MTTALIVVFSFSCGFCFGWFAAERRDARRSRATRKLLDRLKRSAIE